MTTPVQLDDQSFVQVVVSHRTILGYLTSWNERLKYRRVPEKILKFQYANQFIFPVLPKNRDEFGQIFNTLEYRSDCTGYTLPVEYYYHNFLLVTFSGLYSDWNFQIVPHNQQSQCNHWSWVVLLFSKIILENIQKNMIKRLTWKPMFIEFLTSVAFF